MKKKWFLIGFIVGFLIGPVIVVGGFGTYTKYRVDKMDAQEDAERQANQEKTKIPK